MVSVNIQNQPKEGEGVTDSPLLEMNDLVTPTTQQESDNNKENKTEKNDTEQPPAAEQSPMILTPITPNRSQLTPLKGILKRRGEMPTPNGHKVRSLL